MITRRQHAVRAGAGALVALVTASACGGDDDVAIATDPTGPTTTTPVAGTTAPATGPATNGDGPPSTPAPTFEIVTTTVIGAAVGGSAGDIGRESTDPYSEAIRNADGTCSGFDGPGGTWTQGLESGAPVVFVARDGDAQIGTGVIGTSYWEDVGSGREQWNCVFPFEGEIEGERESFRIKVADLPPWVVVRNASDTSQWVVSIDTTVRIDVFTECADPGAAVDAVSAWSSVGTFWSRGIPEQICGAGLAVADVERPCRPPGIASEHIVQVTSGDDPSVVLEDARGLLVDPVDLAPGTAVVVHVATGRPCG